MKLEINKINIIAINVNSLISIQRRLEIINFIKIHKPDILLISETKLDKRHKIVIDDYNIIRKDRDKDNKGGGGTAIIIHKKFKYRIVNIKKKFKTFEITTIEIKLDNNNNKLIVAACYAPQETNDTFIEEFETACQQLNLQQPNNYYILAGDYNAKHSDWKNANDNTRGKKFKKWMEIYKNFYKLQLKHSIKPTYIRSGSYIDLVIHDNRLNISNNLNTIRMESDHKAIQCFLNLTNLVNINNDIAFINTDSNEKLEDYTRKQIDWEKYKNNIIYTYNNHISEGRTTNRVPTDRNLENEDIDKHLETLDKIIIKTMESCTIQTKQKTIKEMYSNIIIDKLYKNKSQTINKIKKIKRNNFNNLNNPIITNEINTYKSLIKNINKLIKENIKIQINKFWQKKIERIKITEKNGNIFKKINTIFRPKSQIEIAELEVDTCSIKSMKNVETAKIKIEDAKYISINKRHITEEEDKLKLIGGYIENETRKCINSNYDKEIEENTKKFQIHKEQNIQQTNFNRNNQANNEEIHKNNTNNIYVYKTSRINRNI